MDIDVKGFLPEPKKSAGGTPYRGRLTLPEIQWTQNGNSDVFATTTVTAEQVADAAESNLLWTDQAVQRGIQPTAPPDVSRQLPLSAGYPDERFYIFYADNADDMTEKLLSGSRLFLNPLVWNLRPGEFEAYWSAEDDELFLYSGKIFLPDSHHRHQAILKAVRAYRDHPASYPEFSPSRQFKVELYFLSREDEGNYFFDKNQRTKPTALSKAYDLTTDDDLSVLAKRVLEVSPTLDKGVNRATDRVSKKTPHFMTLSTLREIMRTFAGADDVEETELEGLAVTAAEFFNMLAGVRPELNAGASWAASEKTLASAGVMLQGYALLMRDFNLDLAKLGSKRARDEWTKKLAALSSDAPYSYGEWSGDFLDKLNPLWSDLGVVKREAKTGRLTVSNTGGTRARTGQALRDRVSEFRNAGRAEAP